MDEPTVEVNIAELPTPIESAKSVLRTVIKLKQTLAIALAAPAMSPSAPEIRALRDEVTVLQLHLAQLDAADGNGLSQIDAEFRGLAQLAAIVNLTS